MGGWRSSCCSTASANREADLLRARFPNLAQFRVATLPNSSVGHGAMINLLLRHNDRDFGLLDHDLYQFDESVLGQLRFADEVFLFCLLSDASADSKWVYPLTHFLYFKVAAFRRLMELYGVGAQSYRRVPEPARSRLAALGRHYASVAAPFTSATQVLRLVPATTQRAKGPDWPALFPLQPKSGFRTSSCGGELPHPLAPGQPGAWRRFRARELREAAGE